MPERTDKVLSKTDKDRAMSDTAYAQSLIQEAFPRDKHGSVYAAQFAAYDFMRRHLRKNMTFRRARSIWEGAARRIDAEEAEALKRAKFEEAQREYSHLRDRLSELDAEIAALRQEMDGATVSSPSKTSGIWG